jgi:hypothetical protein
MEGDSGIEPGTFGSGVLVDRLSIWNHYKHKSESCWFFATIRNLYATIFPVLQRWSERGHPPTLSLLTQSEHPYTRIRRLHCHLEPHFQVKESPSRCRNFIRGSSAVIWIECDQADLQRYGASLTLLAYSKSPTHPAPSSKGTKENFSNKKPPYGGVSFNGAEGKIFRSDRK